MLSLLKRESRERLKEAQEGQKTEDRPPRRGGWAQLQTEVKAVFCVCSGLGYSIKGELFFFN